MKRLAESSEFLGAGGQCRDSYKSAVHLTVLMQQSKYQKNTSGLTVPAKSGQLLK